MLHDPSNALGHPGELIPRVFLLPLGELLLLLLNGECVGSLAPPDLIAEDPDLPTHRLDVFLEGGDEITHVGAHLLEGGGLTALGGCRVDVVTDGGEARGGTDDSRDDDDFFVFDHVDGTRRGGDNLYPGGDEGAVMGLQKL